MNTLNSQPTANMNPTRTLSFGQRVILTAYLAAFEPSEVYDPELDILCPTDEMVPELEGAARMSMNAVADHLATLGYRYHFIHELRASGWILRPIASPFIDVTSTAEADTCPELDFGTDD